MPYSRCHAVPIAQTKHRFDRALLNRLQDRVALGRKFEALDMTSSFATPQPVRLDLPGRADEGFMADMYLRAISGFLSDGQC